jgi:hypothetical protein
MRFAVPVGTCMKEVPMRWLIVLLAVLAFTGQAAAACPPQLFGKNEHVNVE